MQHTWATFGMHAHTVIIPFHPTFGRFWFCFACWISTISWIACDLLVSSIAVTKPHAGHHSGFPGRPHPGGNRGFPGHLYPGGNRRNGSHPNPHRHYDDDDGMGTDEPHDGDSLFDHEQQPSRGEHDTHRQHQTTATGAPARHSTELHKKHRRQGIIFTPLNIALCAGVAVLFCVLMLACLRRRAKARRDATLDTVGYNVMRDEVIWARSDFCDNGADVLCSPALAQDESSWWLRLLIFRYIQRFCQCVLEFVWGY